MRRASLIAVASLALLLSFPGPSVFGGDTPNGRPPRRDAPPKDEPRPTCEPAPGIGVQGQPLSAAQCAEACTLASLLSSRVSALTQAGEYEEALCLTEQALTLEEQAHGPDDAHVAAALTTLGSLLRRLGFRGEARLLYERALRINRSVFGSYHPTVATSLTQLALLLSELGCYDEARPLYERALVITQRVMGPDDPQVATCLDCLGTLFDDQGSPEQARPLHERALKIREQALGRDHPSVAATLDLLGLGFHLQGAYEEARPLCDRALEIRRDALGPDHPTVASSLLNLAALLCAQGQQELVGPLLERSLNIIERYLRQSFVALQEPERLDLVYSLRHYLDQWLASAPLLGQSGYAAVLRFKGLAARAAAAERRLARAGGANADARVAVLRAAERRLASLANAMPAVFEKEKRASWRQAYAQAAKERERLALALARDFAPLRAGLERLDLKRTDIQAELRKDEVLVDFLRTGDHYLAWVLKKEGLPARLDLGASDLLEPAVVAFVKQVVDAEDDVGLLRAGQVLRELVLAPLAPHLGPEVRTIYLCPDAALAAVPFAALPGRSAGRYLIDDYLLVSVSMAQDLVPWRDAAPAGKGALLVGGVDYEQAVPDSDGANKPTAGAPRQRRVSHRSTYVALPGTRPEVASIEARLEDGCTTLLGRDATEHRLRTEVKGKRILHFATHGFARFELLRERLRPTPEESGQRADPAPHPSSSRDPMLLAGLALAGANPRLGGYGDDGILTALEASHLDLDGVELVVLSACETARGRSESGEGVIGLVQGFQMAGAKRVMGSLWKVDDEATRQLMSSFYEGLLGEQAGHSPGQALRAAALRLRDTGCSGKRSFHHPRHWAAFVTYGR